MLLEALKAGVIDTSIDEFYYLSRSALVKDEAHFDKFDRAFGAYFKGVEMIADFTRRCRWSGCARTWSSNSARKTRPRSRRWAGTS